MQFDCGKLQALATLLRRLKSGGHKVLIFTQMTKMLDILEAFLNLYGYAYCRLDGSTRPEQRQILMQRFNTDERLFAFILSTRSGGFGINLTGADTVVFYDSDWNPAMDAQAQDRAHRIGQTREVHIYRMVCKGTIEENILQKSMQKRELDHFAIQAGNFNTEHFTKARAKKRTNGGETHETLGPVVGGEQGAAAMSIFDQAMSRAAVAKATAPADGGGDGSAETAAGKKGKNAAEADEVARLMDEAQDDVDKAAVITAANEEADDAAEFGDDIREKEPGEDLDDDDAKEKEKARPSANPTGSEPKLVRASGAPGSPPATPAPDDENRTLSLTRVNTTLEGDDAFAEEMMRKVQASASRGEALEMQLKPVERYAVRYLEETLRILEEDATAAVNLVDFEEKEWELEQLEKQKAAAEAAEEDDELIIEGWETGDADDEYRRRVEDARREAEARAELERKEAERWAAMYATPSLEAERAAAARVAGADAALDGEPREGPDLDGGPRQTGGDPFVAGVPRRARSGSPAPGGGAAPPLRVTFKLGARGPSGLSRASLGGDGAREPSSAADPEKKRKKAHKKRARDGRDETSAERDARRRARRLGRGEEDGERREGGAFASPGGGGAVASPATATRAFSSPASAGGAAWRVDEDTVLCALVDAFGGAGWDLAAHAIAHRDAAQCRDRFRRVAASRAASLGAASATPSPSAPAALRITPETTKALFRQTAEETFPGCEGAPEPATALREGVRAARDALASAGGVGAAKAAVAAAAARFFASVLEFGRASQPHE